MSDRPTVAQAAATPEQIEKATRDTIIARYAATKTEADRAVVKELLVASRDAKRISEACYRELVERLRKP